MTTRIVFVTGCIVIGLALFSGCGKDNSSDPLGNCDGSGWALMVEEEINNFYEATTDYYSDPSMEKCEVYKKAAGNYLSALKEAHACVPVADEQEYQKTIAEAEAELKEIDCSQEP